MKCFGICCAHILKIAYIRVTPKNIYSGMQKSDFSIMKRATNIMAEKMAQNWASAMSNVFEKRE